MTFVSTPALAFAYVRDVFAADVGDARWYLLPAIVCAVAVVFVDLLTGYLGGYEALTDATGIVGTTLVVALLFNTAVAIRQRGGELERLYDWTTWREQSLE